jgi:hypothetical protein
MSEHVQKVMAKHMTIGHLVNAYRVFDYGFCLGTGWFTLAAVEALKKKERQDETQFTTETGGKTSLGPRYFVS